MSIARRIVRGLGVTGAAVAPWAAPPRARRPRPGFLCRLLRLGSEGEERSVGPPRPTGVDLWRAADLEIRRRHEVAEERQGERQPGEGSSGCGRAPEAAAPDPSACRHAPEHGGQERLRQASEPPGRKGRGRESTLAAARAASQGDGASVVTGEKRKDGRLGQTRGQEDDARVVAEGTLESPPPFEDWCITNRSPSTSPANRDQGSVLSHQSGQQFTMRCDMSFSFFLFFFWFGIYSEIKQAQKLPSPSGPAGM